MGPNKPPTKAEQAFQDAVRDLGCICCWKVGGYRPAEIHHIVEAKKRLGQMYVLPLCEYHHRGYPVNGMTSLDTEATLGPSLARNKRAFVERFGTELELLEEVTQRIRRVA